MYFKKLELVGFKSFLNKTTLHFEPGVTAVVGPNGCGKSNLVDSLRWVLGEQSVKALRGSDMQDVIFNGTDSKEPLGMAEVTLTFDNSNRLFKFDDNEVSVTRRIFRSGESEYLLNKSLVRLKDILDLLMGTGIGAESYSLVAQGKIDLILSSRPEDRRLVFDEASGITKYKSQKKEAARKLEETEQNLLRVNDIITEVKRQIGSLERQANKARRYKEVFEELKSKEINLAIQQKKEFLQEKNNLLRELHEMESEEERLQAAIKTQEYKISSRKLELKNLEDNILGLKNEILGLDNLLIRHREHISFNQERIKELETTQNYLTKQQQELEDKIILDEEKLNNLKEEYSSIDKNIQEKNLILKEKENQLKNLTSSIKASLENIGQGKKEILDLVTQATNTHNEITNLSSQEQVFLARKRRLELERAKVKEEKSAIEDNLSQVNQELENINKTVEDLEQKNSALKNEREKDGEALNTLNSDIQQWEKQKSALESHKELMEKLKTEYEGIDESLNATVYLDKMPPQDLTGLVVKIKSIEEENFKLSGEAKPFDLDTGKIEQRLAKIRQDLEALRDTKTSKEKRIEELNKTLEELEQKLRSQEIALANKKTQQAGVLEQFNKVKEEEDIITLELEDLEKDISKLTSKLNQLEVVQGELNKRQKQLEETQVLEHNNINLNSNLREKTLIEITQIKTEVEALTQRVNSEAATLKLLEDTYGQDKSSLENIKRQADEAKSKVSGLAREIKECESKIKETEGLLEKQKDLLKEKEDAKQCILDTTSDMDKNIEADRVQLDTLKNKLHTSKMQDKDIDFKYLSLKERLLQSYKIELDAAGEVVAEVNPENLLKEIEVLKEKLDSYGNVNLLAIEEYDELKQRCDFLVQQQNDLISAKESLQEAILKINRTTKKMFQETFEQVRLEFRNYFRLLFNGGDAQLFLIDEQDVLESGIEIICRPPGRKLQNVLLLSGGEKALSAIALIFAILKVKPTPFCIVDEIDAALDEANVGRFSSILQEFAKRSQFIVITHNKRTIANADVMYGITMEESGISKIVSVKFSQSKPQATGQPEPVLNPA